MKLRSPRFYHQSAQYKRHLVRQAKSKPCVDCLAEGRRADWPWPAMTLDHTGRKTMIFTQGGWNFYLRNKSWGMPSFEQCSPDEIKHELATCDPVCAGHHQIRTRARLLAADPEAEDENLDENESEDEEIALFSREHYRL